VAEINIASKAMRAGDNPTRDRLRIDTAPALPLEWVGDPGPIGPLQLGKGQFLE